ncbi:MAG TPA: hypothetical protein VJP80_04455 [Candidatus Saccharimonadales bacterium]|nr:hypothetical protein [Candidatus Saccharimonadales bacterium]
MGLMRRSWPYVALLLLVATGLIMARQRDAIMDWAILRGYHAPSNVAQLASQDTFSAYARRLFFVNKPQIDDKQAFNRHCTNNTSDSVVVLGCYTGNRQGIFLYDVTDSRLNGIEQVTAAHEMLHQAYDRLSKSQRAHINALLQQYYETSASSDIKTQFASYHKTEPGEEWNEMHSVIGTEVVTLPKSLEDYYQQYFSNRSSIARFYQNYQGEFTQRQQQIASYDSQLDMLKTQIDAKKSDLSAREASLTAQRSQMEQWKAAGQISAYNAAVPGFNAQVDSYRSELAAANQLIDQYNSLLGQRNAIAVQEQQLEQAVNSQVLSAAGQ